jgi:hypothetical protein
MTATERVYCHVRTDFPKYLSVGHNVFTVRWELKLRCYWQDPRVSKAWDPFVSVVARRDECWLSWAPIVSLYVPSIEYSTVGVQTEELESRQ